MYIVRKHLPTFIQMSRYFVAAGIGLLIDFGLVVVCKEVLGLYYLVAICIGFLAGLAVAYILSNRFVFGAPKTSHKQAFMLFGIIGLVGLGILNLLVWIFTSGFGINYLVSKALATIVVFMWNFFARKRLFKAEQDYLEA